ncbi:MAG: arginine deiminase [Phaeodactylibacter sp.]|nr:arginine deiminase [Phaeodactylibacter sp.]MCB9265666.1 arginine deiminase [Lewinellaceae bacterium]MCB9288371.1 arginine deiminase [Lewinellaceae bacterium]
MANKVHVSSEIGMLRRVIVHRPDEGIARISPKRAEELLFDDIVYLPRMQEEHDIFTNVLRFFIGSENVLGTTNLLREALRHDEESKHEMISRIVDYEELPTSYLDMLLSMPDELLAKVLVNGYYPEEDYFLFDPIPNFIFTRDIAVTVNDHVVITKPAKEARFRENYLTRFIIWAHPIFRDLRENGRIINLNRVDEFPPSRRGEMISIEGGDMMILNKEYLLIGCSERTTEYAVRSLKDVLIEKGVIKHVVQVNIPNDRSYMHIDTVFTQISRNHLVAYKPIVEDGLGSYVTVYGQDGVERHYPTVKEFLLSEINSKMQFIWSGDGESPYQEREQWTDGCNLVTIKPGVALTYDRNPMTEKAFEKAGYRTAHARELLAAFKDGIIKPEEITNTIILLPSNELSRARGGSHCMTCPIEREDL